MVVGVSALAVLLGCGRSSAQQKPAESSPARPVSSENGAENEFVSARYGFRWRLPPDWAFVSPDEITDSPVHPGIDVVAASNMDDDEPNALIVMVKDVFSLPDEEPRLDPEKVENLEWYASAWMQAAGAKKVGRSRLKLFGADAFRFDGSVEDADGTVHATFMVFYRNRRRFELVCYATRYETGTPCASALAEFVIDEMDDAPQPGDRPRVLHLRDEKLGIQFDAPDDGWLAIGPRTAGDGAQVVWIWRKEDRQIDVQVMDLANRSDTVDEAWFVELMTEHFRKPGSTVTVKASKLSGLRCSHIQIRRTQGYQEDLFVQKRGRLLYGLLVNSPVTDQALLDRARAGFRVIER